MYMYEVDKKRDVDEFVFQRMAETKEPVALFCGDMSHEGVRAEAFAEIERDFGRLDVLINNIPGGKPDTFDSCESEQMLAAFSQKAIAYIDTMKRAAAMMKRHEYSRIIQIVGNLMILKIDLKNCTYRDVQ